MTPNLAIVSREAIHEFEEALGVSGQEDGAVYRMLSEQLSRIEGRMEALQKSMERAAAHRGATEARLTRVDSDIDKLATMAGNNAKAIGSLERRAAESRIKWGVLGVVAVLAIELLLPLLK